MQSAPFLTTCRELLLGLAGAALASAKVRNGMYDPELAAHTSIWLIEAECRKQPLANILDEALSTTHAAGYRRVELNADFLASGLKDRTLRLLEKKQARAGRHLHRRAVVHARGRGNQLRQS